MKKTLVILALTLMAGTVNAQYPLIGEGHCTADQPQCSGTAEVRRQSVEITLQGQTNCPAVTASCLPLLNKPKTFKLTVWGTPTKHKCENHVYTYQVGVVRDDLGFGVYRYYWLVGGNPTMQKIASGAQGCTQVIGFTQKFCQPHAWYPGVYYPTQQAAIDSGNDFLSIRIFGFGEEPDPNSDEGICHEVAVMPEDSDIFGDP